MCIRDRAGTAHWNRDYERARKELRHADRRLLPVVPRNPARMLAGSPARRRRCLVLVFFLGEVGEVITVSCVRHGGAPVRRVCIARELGREAGQQGGNSEGELREGRCHGRQVLS